MPVKINDTLNVTGDIVASGSIQFQETTARLSIPAAAFEVTSPSSAYYVNNGFDLGNQRTDQNENFVAPVYLPDGAKVSKVTMYYNSQNSEQISLSLARSPHGGATSETIATGSSQSGSGGTELTLDTDYTTISNENNSHRIFATMPKKNDAGSSATLLYEVVIEYTRIAP
ncbi:hypothetical protein KKC60_04785 [Patescibacteria group bacterium]|nr:hypothetical protein [Patescibacteria group bacterium]